MRLPDKGPCLPFSTPPLSNAERSPQAFARLHLTAPTGWPFLGASRYDWWSLRVGCSLRATPAAHAPPTTTSTPRSCGLWTRLGKHNSSTAVVPQLFGIYRASLSTTEHARDPAHKALIAPARIDTWAMVLEDAGNPMATDRPLAPEAKEEVLQAYRRIHAAGVIHNDVSPRHWYRRREDSEVVLIDFSAAKLREEWEDDPKHWEGLATHEMETVRSVLDDPGRELGREW